MIEGYEFAPNRWLALRDAPPMGIKVRGRLSPGLLAQELVAEPWQVAVACCLLNRTTRAQAHPALWRVLHKYRTPEALACADHASLGGLIESCGLVTRRCTVLTGLGRGFVDEVDVGELDGIGPYALASWYIFVDGVDVVHHQDHELVAFLRWSRLLRLRRT